MKVVVLGATGDMGRRAAVELGRSPEVTQLTLAGRNLDKAQALAREIGGPAQAVRVDANEPSSLVDVMAEHDVAAGAIGPFYLYEVAAARAAIEAGVPYVSICDDHDATLEVLKLDSLAKERGVTVLSGAGWTPGLTNIMAKKGVGMLDQADEIDISWVGASSDAEGFAVILHTLHILTGEVPTFREGKHTTIQAGTEPKRVRFPEPIGTVTVRHVGHPEPVTIPQFISGLKTVSLRGGLTESFLNTLGLMVARLGLTRTPKRKARLARLMKPLLPLLEKIGRPVQPQSGAHVEVRGTKDGRSARVELIAVDRMMNLTALPHVVATLMVGRGEVHHPGVIAIEAPGGPDPERFLAAVAELGIAVDVRLIVD